MADPFTWHTLAETRDDYQTATVLTFGSRPDPSDSIEPEGSLAKAAVTPAVQAAKASYLGRVYESWSSWPVTEDLGAAAPPGDGEPLPPGAHTVVFRDLRFAPTALGALAGSGGSGQSPVLAGYVVVGSGSRGEGEILSEWMDGRLQR